MQRREFVNTCFWISAGLLGGCSKSVDGATIITYRLLKGKVSSGGNGMADVVVSDGFNVIKTAADGSFTMNVPSNAKHAFVSVPSGYAFPHDNNIVRHYITLDGSSAQQLDFELQPLNSSDDQHQFIIWADPQIINQNDVNRLTSTTVPDLQQYVQTLAAGTLIHGITVGDLVYDKMPLFSSYSAAIEKCGLPFYQLPGNHDIEYDKGKENSDSVYRQMYGPTYYSFNRGQVHYVVLNDVSYVGSGDQYKGFIPAEQLRWLQTDLSLVSASKLIVVCLHIQTTWVDNRDDLYNVLRGYKVHIMAGHSHFNQNFVNGDIYEHVHGTVCGAWWMGPICSDGTPLGYAVYEVNGVNLEWHYKSVGFEKEYQIRTNLYAQDGQQKLQANVWNWDPEWKVEWSSDDVLQGIMPKADDIDKLADKLYSGPDLPVSRTWVEPNLTDHVFSVDIQPGVKEIKVIATDRFGKVYTNITQV